MQIVTSEFQLPAGQESQSCYYTTLSNENEVFVRQFDAYQGPGGHHVILFTPLVDRPDGTVEDCTGGDTMVNYLPLVLSIELNHLELDNGLAIRLPPHAKVVVQSHYINTTAEVATVHDTVNLGFVAPGTNVTQVGFWASAYLSLAVPPQQPSTLKYRCTAERDMQLLSLIGHMHNAGSHLSIDIGPPGALQRIYTVDTWESSFRDTPPQEHWTMDNPFIVHAGDVMEVTCNWYSMANEVLAFPAEMCGSNAWFFPAEGSITCAGEFVEGDAVAP